MKIGKELPPNLADYLIYAKYERHSKSHQGGSKAHARLRAMQMVATSKMKKAQDEAKTGRPYALILADIIVSIADEFEEITQSYFVQRPIRHRGILVIGTDKGLCGALNGNLSENSMMSRTQQSSLLLANEHPSF